MRGKVSCNICTYKISSLPVIYEYLLNEIHRDTRDNNVLGERMKGTKSVDVYVSFSYITRSKKYV